jgi:hypothetical protein
MSAMLVDSAHAGHGRQTELTSAQSVLSLLEESDPALKVYALQQLSQDSVINGFWHEIADILPKVMYGFPPSAPVPFPSPRFLPCALTQCVLHNQ